jgi:hypothetical protein
MVAGWQSWPSYGSRATVIGCRVRWLAEEEVTAGRGGGRASSKEVAVMWASGKEAAMAAMGVARRR